VKKIFLVGLLICLSAIIFIPFLASAETLCNTGGSGFVPCGQSDDSGKIACPCEIGHFFTMLVNVYNFLVLDIATPLAVLALTIGGIFILISAGNPNLHSTGKKIVYSAIIGLVLAFCSWLIINTLMSAIGFTGNWSNPF
jgi:hypothetical protein